MSGVAGGIVLSTPGDDNLIPQRLFDTGALSKDSSAVRRARRYVLNDTGLRGDSLYNDVHRTAPALADERKRFYQSVNETLPIEEVLRPASVYNPSSPTLSTWSVFILFAFTNTFLAGVIIALVVSIAGDYYMSPLTFTITTGSFLIVFLLLWFYVGFGGIDGESFRRDEFVYSEAIVGSNRRRQQVTRLDTSLDLHRFDLTTISYSDYKSRAFISGVALLGCFLFTTAMNVVFCARYPDGSAINVSSLFTEASSRAWATVTLFDCALYLATFTTFINFSFCYWNLVWCSFDPSLYKNPFFPERMVLFNVRTVEPKKAPTVGARSDSYSSSLMPSVRSFFRLNTGVSRSASSKKAGKQ